MFNKIILSGFKGSNASEKWEQHIFSNWLEENEILLKKNNIEYEREETETPAELIAWLTANLSQRQTYNNIFNFSAWTPRSTDRKTKIEKERDSNHIMVFYVIYTYNVLFSQSNFL